jgi:hypothetical protein
VGVGLDVFHRRQNQWLLEGAVCDQWLIGEGFEDARARSGAQAGWGRFSLNQAEVGSPGWRSMRSKTGEIDELVAR